MINYDTFIRILQEEDLGECIQDFIYACPNFEDSLKKLTEEKLRAALITLKKESPLLFKSKDDFIKNVIAHGRGCNQKRVED